MLLLDAYKQAIEGQSGIVGDALPASRVREVERHMAEISRNPSAFYRVHHDFETFCELSLPDVGADAYSRHESCEVLMAAWCINSGKISQWAPAEAHRDTGTLKGQYQIPRELKDAMRDPRAIKFAWNKPFEWSIWKNVLGMETPHEHWRDPMVMAYSLSLPGSLEKAGEVVELPEDMRKQKGGTALMTKFSKPRKPTKRKPQTRNFWHDLPEDWERYKEYNRVDVLAERGIYFRLKPFDMPNHEWVLWVIDQWINTAGIPINMRLVRNAIDFYEFLEKRDRRRMEQITGLDNVGSIPQLLPWLKENGYPFDDLKKGHVVRAKERLKGELPGINDPERAERAQQVVEALELRLVLSKSSVKKYYALERSADVDGDFGVIRNSFQFAGAARTWRWAGRIFQAQNLPKPANKWIEKNIATVVDDLEHFPAPSLVQLYDIEGQDPYDVLTSCIRPCAQAIPGHTFIDADLNAIENRVLGWMADCRKILEVFEKNLDPYLAFGTYMFNKTYEMLEHEYKVLGDGKHRTIAKPGVLGCGYMLGAGKRYFNDTTGEYEATGLLGYAWNMGIKEFTLDDSKLSVDTFRREFVEVKNMWYDLERAMKRCIKTCQPTEYRMLRFEMKPPFLRMVLPSGRALHYCRPRLEMVMTPWGEEKLGITYEGMNDKNQWVRINTHGGKITENADQAMARDLLANAMYLAKLRYNMDIRLHVHDQAVAMPRIEVAERDLVLLQECLNETPRWAPDLPLGSAGFISPIFIKD